MRLTLAAASTLATEVDYLILALTLMSGAVLALVLHFGTLALCQEWRTFRGVLTRALVTEVSMDGRRLIESLVPEIAPSRGNDGRARRCRCAT